MNYSLIPSLEHRARVMVAITLWNQDDIRALTERFNFTFFHTTETQKEWQVIEKKVMDKGQELPLPYLLKEKVLDCITPIGFEISRWRLYHQTSSCVGGDPRFFRDFLNKLCWTPQGTVDRKKTAEALIKDASLDIAKRYILACIYCFKNDILMLWNAMPEDCRKSFYSEEDSRHINQYPLVVFWTYDIMGNVTRIDRRGRFGNRMCTLYQYAFEYAADHGNKAATEYFWQQLNYEEREESLVFFGRYLIGSSSSCLSDVVDDYPGVLFFLLSRMNEEQQLEALERHPNHVLKALLKWPWQDFFMETAERMWAFLPTDVYYSILEFITNSVIIGLKDYNYQRIFRDFWQKSPVTHKEYVVHKCTSGLVLFDLFQLKDIENIKMILEYATILDREEIIFSSTGKKICECLIFNEEMDLLEFFVQECISSKDVMLKFRKEFEEYVIASRSVEAREKEKDRWNDLFRLLNDLTQKCDKRKCVEEENNDSAKRLCNLQNE